jgi:hypothetical protein
MTCRLDAGGCGYEFCWVCGGKYSGGHFTAFGCPDHGGSPADGQDAFKDSLLGALSAPLFFAVGVLITEALSLPLVGINLWLCVSALLVLSFLFVQTCWQEASIVAVALAALPVGSVLAGTWLSLCYALLHAIGVWPPTFNAATAAIMIEVGIYSLMWKLHPLQRKDVGLTAGFIILSVVVVGVARGLYALADLSQNSLDCMEGNCGWVRTGLRWFVLAGLFVITILALFSSSFLLIYRFVKIFESIQKRRRELGNDVWIRWGCTAASALAICEMTIISSAHSGSSFQQVSDWGLTIVAMLLCLAAGAYCTQQVAVPGVFPCIVPPWMAAVLTAWICRVFLELRASAMDKSASLPSNHLPYALVLGIHLVSGVIASLSILRASHVYWRSWRSRARFISATMTVALGLAAGYVVCWQRDAVMGLWTERLMAGACSLAVMAGSLAFRIGFHFTFTKA